MRSETDRRLIHESKHGDADAFGVLMRRYASHVYGIAMSQVMNHEDAQDISQEAFVKAYTRLWQLRDASQFVGWLSRIAVSCARNRQRSDQRQAALRAATPARNTRPAEQERYERDEDMRGILMTALATLTPTFRQPLVLRYMDDMPYPEIARCLSITPQTAQRRVSRAREKLAHYFRRSGRDVECADVLGSGALACPAAYGWLQDAAHAVQAHRAPQPPSSTSTGARYAPYGLAAGIAASGLFAVTAGPLLSMFMAQRSSDVDGPWAFDGSATIDARVVHEMPAYVFDSRPLGSPGRPYSGIGDPDPAGIADVNGIDVATLSGAVATVRAVSPGEAHIWLANADGSSERQLTFGPYTDSNPELSPDGEWVAFARIIDTPQGRADVWKVETSGGTVVRLTSDPAYTGEAPTWTPDGTEITFTRAPWVGDAALPYRHRLWSIASTGGAPHMISRDKGLSILDPAYSPDGRHIYVTGEAEQERFAIQRIDVASGSAQELSSQPEVLAEYACCAKSVSS